MDIITWPVIESPDFYTMFKNLNLHLSNMQGHDTARNFLRMMKMLMAKLKVRKLSLRTCVCSLIIPRSFTIGDHCHVSSDHTIRHVTADTLSIANMTMYKVKYILSTLPSALAYGAAEVAPQLEPLKVVFNIACLSIFMLTT